MHPSVPPLGEVPWRYTRTELWVDGVVHALGVFLACLGSVLFAVFVASRIDRPDLAAAAVYLATLLLSIAASAVYNVWPISPTKWVLRRLDHSAIYLLIAGTYTPFMVKMGTWWMLAGVWAIALLGVSVKLLRPGRFDRLAIALYLVLGWSGVATYETLITALTPTVIWLIVAGGLTYSLGVIFHVWERLRFQNAIWHGFVLIAASIHFAAVWCSAVA
jgi:hemolysin III